MAARGEKRHKSAGHGLQIEPKPIGIVEIHLRARATGHIIKIDNSYARGHKSLVGRKRSRHVKPGILPRPFKSFRAHAQLRKKLFLLSAARPPPPPPPPP